MNRTDRAKQTLLRLLSSLPDDAPLELDEVGWRELAAISGQHLLGPQLHQSMRDRGLETQVPAWIADRFAVDYRDSAVRALLFQRTLMRMARLLSQRGISHTLLKGARLAWHAYPHPALRPMRDIDVLVPEDRALEAFEWLLANGCARYSGRNKTGEQALAHDKHLPPIRMVDTDIQIEVHTRLFMPAISASADAEMLQPALLLERSVARPLENVEAAFLPAEEALVHCVVHAVYDSRFNNGPMVLSDLRYMLAAEPLDWARVWALLEQGGWTRAAILLLRLTERLHGPLPIEWPGSARPEVPEKLQLEAAYAMMADKERTRDTEIRLDGAVAAGGPSRYLRLAFPRKFQLKDFARTSSDGAWVWLLYPAWLATRLIRFGTSLFSRRQQREVSGLIDVMGWVRGGQA